MAPSSLPAALSSATGHQECVLTQFVRHEGLQHLFHVTALSCNHCDARGLKHRFKGPGDRTADEHVYPQCRHRTAPTQGFWILHNQLIPPDHLAIKNVYDQQMACSVEYWRDSAVMYGNGRSHT